VNLELGRIDARDRICVRCQRHPNVEPHEPRCPNNHIAEIPHCRECGKPRGEHFERCPLDWRNTRRLA
jgi:predicted amidophosphoribosyltransferase